MSAIYDNWDRLVRATLRREQLREIGLRSPSELSLASSFSSFNFTASSGRLSSFSHPEDGPTVPTAQQIFTFLQLARATKNFSPDLLLHKSGHGQIYKGQLESGQVVVVKRFALSAKEWSGAFLEDVLMLSVLHHPNIVKLIGYYADGDYHRLHVYEFMPLGSLRNHLHDLPSDKKPLDWNTRMKIAVGVAKGLEYLHDKAHPPVIHRHIKLSNILLDEGFHPRLSDFELAKYGPAEGNAYLSTRAVGTFGYAAPEYMNNGNLTFKSDVYSFGVVLLEIITGRKAFDQKAVDGRKPPEEYILTEWAKKILFREQTKFGSHQPKAWLADPLLRGQYPKEGLYKALETAAMCLQEHPTARPRMREVVNALTKLAQNNKFGQSK